MSTEIDIEHNADINNRVDDLAAPIENSKSSFKFKTNPPITTAAQLVDEVVKGQESFREAVVNSTAGVKIPVADIRNLKVKANTVIDFSTMTEDDVYNLDIPMSARPFDSEDALKVDLRDTNYVARWVNKNSQRMALMLSRGFSMVVAEDLNSELHLEVHKDAAGHYVMGDVICMKIQKERYFQALRAAAVRAANAIDPKGAHKAAIAHAAQFIDKETAGGYSAESPTNKMKIYAPDFQI